MPKKGVGRGVGGGPKTKQGKENSRGNATKHGLRSSLLVILPDEKQSDRDAVERGWREEYQPEGYAEDRLVQELIDSDWALIRAKRRVAAAEEQATEDWTEESKHHLELMHRYKTAAERSFYRAFNAVQGLRKDRRAVQKIEEKFRELKREVKELKKRFEPVAEGFDPTKENPYGLFGPTCGKSRSVCMHLSRVSIWRATRGASSCGEVVPWKPSLPAPGASSGYGMPAASSTCSG